MPRCRHHLQQRNRYKNCYVAAEPNAQVYVVMMITLSGPVILLLNCETFAMLLIKNTDTEYCLSFFAVFTIMFMRKSNSKWPNLTTTLSSLAAV